MLDKLGNAVANGLAGFYGRALPVRWEDGLEVEKERTKAYSGMGHRDRYAPRIQVYAPVIAGGYGITHYYAVGAAALIDQIDRALMGRPGQPMRVAVGCSIAQTFVRLGFVPTAAAPHPLDWWPTHLLRHLSGAHIIEAWLLARLRAGLGTRSARGAVEGECLDD